MKTMRSVLAAAVFVFAAAGMVFAEGLEFSGLLDSTVTLGAGAGEGPGFFCGLEEYANIRMQAKLRDGAAFYGALNLIAAGGTPAVTAAALAAGNAAAYPGLTASSFAAGENYAAALELERLYFRFNGDYLDFDGGLLRIAFGYGQVFGPSDFLNPKNPLVPDARPRAVLGGTLSAYLLDSLKLQVFGAAPKNPLAPEGGGGLAGLSGDQHWDKASLQVVYAFESPEEGSPQGIHRYGLSFKADLALGFTAELLYTHNPEEHTGLEGLAFSGGADYSFFDGRWYVLAEYLYNGASSSTSARSGNPAGFSGEHFFYTGISWLYDDLSAFTLACLSAFSDLSFSPVLSAEHELFQGFTLSLSGRFLLDRDLFSGDGNRGELGPLPPGASGGSRFILTVRARLRF
ncbi:MAG: hypothetical protein LBD78_08090 [Spirochaetaceae bacterium]|jgi:hypothetical protein|nr:hypothetical protein [Spirochaetaceae bacterium]